MTVVHSDLAEGHRLSRNIDGYTIERSYLVDDVTGSAESRLYNAIIQSKIPQYGEAHPSIPDVTVTDISAEPVKGDSSQVIVTVIYSIPGDDQDIGQEGGAGQAIITTALTNETTHFDIDGNLIKASYVSGVNSISTNYSPVEVQRPQMRVTLSRRESVIPKDHLKTFLGRINSVAWSGFPAQTWLCSGISVREDQGAFDVDYSFEYREQFWKGELILPLSASEAEQNPIDRETGNAYALFDVYQTANFNDLGLSF